MLWRTGHVAEKWNIAAVIPGKDDCNNYQAISLLSSCYGIYSKLLNNQMNKIAKSIILDKQHGFQKSYSSIDCVFVSYIGVAEHYCNIYDVMV
jgi:hypothetical protein